LPNQPHRELYAIALCHGEPEEFMQTGAFFKKDEAQLGRAGASPGINAPKRRRSTNTGALSTPALSDGGDRLLPMKAVIDITSWSRTSINRLIREGRFPLPLKLGKSKIAFRESEIRAYVEAQLRRPGALPSDGAQA
jgi:predicted DNA-binding transcriptional regulator AlpA